MPDKKLALCSCSNCCLYVSWRKIKYRIYDKSSIKWRNIIHFVEYLPACLRGELFSQLEGDATKLQYLKNLTKDRFLRGFVVYLGREIIPFGEELFAIPISAIWR